MAPRIALFALSTVCLFAGGTAAAAISFATRSDFAAGGSPRSALLGQVDGDDHLDLLLAHDAGLSVLFGTGHGAFTAPRTIRTSTDVSLLAAADFNDDGHLDVGFAGQHSPGVRLRYGDGTGGFATAQVLDTASSPTALFAGKLANSEHAVLIVGLADSVSIFRATSSGLQHQDSLTVSGHPASITVADLNADGRQDLIVPVSPGTLAHLFSAEKTGGFRKLADLDAGTNPQRGVPVRFAADGRIDLVFLDDLGLTHARADSRGGFARAERILRSDALQAIEAADLDGDGTTEVVAADGVRSAVVVARSGPDGRVRVTHAYEVDREPVGVVAAKLRSATAPDVISVNRLGNSVTLLQATGNGRFSGPAILDGGVDPTDAVSADFDDDRHADIAVADDHGGSIHVLLGNGRGEFAKRATIHVGARPRALLGVDLDEDEHLDLAVANFDAATVTVLSGDGSGNFAAPLSVAVGLGPVGVASADFDEDGHADLAAANSLSDSVSVLYGDGQGHFPRTRSFRVVRNPTFVVAGALDRGGHTALIVGNERSRAVSILRGGPGGPQEPETDTMRRRIRPLIAEDFDGDGHIDLVGPASGDDRISILRGTGPNEFAAPALFPIGRDPRAVAAADFDEDGRVDLLVLSQGTQSLLLLRNTSGEAGARRPPSGAIAPDLWPGTDPWRVPGNRW